MSVIRVGSTSKYADGWDLVFGGSRGRQPAGKKTRTPTARKAKARPAKKAKAKAAAKRTKSGGKAGRRKS